MEQYIAELTSVPVSNIRLLYSIRNYSVYLTTIFDKEFWIRITGPLNI